MADKEEFITIIQENKAVIYKICYIYSHSQEELADLYQEVVLNLWRSWPGFRKESKASIWIYRVGLNTCISFVRKNKRRIKALPLKTDINLFDESNHEFDALQELYKMIDCLNKEDNLILAQQRAVQMKKYTIIATLHTLVFVIMAFAYIIFSDLDFILESYWLFIFELTLFVGLSTFVIWNYFIEIKKYRFIKEILNQLQEFKKEETLNANKEIIS